jgi:AhpD family alkylhydroperoxidase
MKNLLNLFIVASLFAISVSPLSAQEKMSPFTDLYEFMEKYEKECPDVVSAFYNLHDTIVMKKGTLSIKQKELIAMGIGISDRCKYCIYFHTAQAKKNGATDEEILEAASVAVYMGGGPAFSYIKYVFDALEELGKMEEQKAAEKK